MQRAEKLALYIQSFKAQLRARNTQACGEGQNRFKHIVRCDLAQENEMICAVREDVHILQEDDFDQYCPECRGETPPESPQ
ncbi:hypothetical protein CFIMG_000762RA [Ceratocystis fimbriata CBS 114723]|uniref:Uncharacterized protein n=1 Tax=Ceratocystis fimbriata CBS 114723 TaxID=1035309 RepID=A0A2C5X3X8_9PEZI|nr:hypothetical protein CFIMG_000762RA [Ceratocystis fimbriata CBS 114723]